MRRTGRKPTVALVIAGVSGALALSCSRLGSFENLMDIDVCDPGSAKFTLEIDNPFFPLAPGDEPGPRGGPGAAITGPFVRKAAKRRAQQR